jgi:3-hydroxyisobutyrate dehydrogenase
VHVGFIGLGHPGAPMSARILAAGHDLVGHDVRPGVAALVEQICRRARAQDGDAGGEMLPIRLLTDLTGTDLRPTGE